MRALRHRFRSFYPRLRFTHHSTRTTLPLAPLASHPDNARMASICFYFQVHQPYRLRRYSVFDTDRHYFDDFKNGDILRKVAHK